MRSLWLFAALLLLVLPWAAVKAQEETGCLSADAVKALLAQRNGETWTYAPEDKIAVNSATTCVQREGSVLRYRATGGSESQVEWVGRPEYGHWYRVVQVGTDFVQYPARQKAGLPSAAVVYIAVRYTANQVLHIFRFIPQMTWAHKTSVITEFAVALKSGDDSSLVLNDRTQTVYFVPSPVRIADGSPREEPHLLSEGLGGSSSVFAKRYAPAVLDFVESGYFGQLGSVVAGQVTIPGIGITAMRAGVTTVSPNRTQAPEETLRILPPASASFSYIVLAIVPLKQDLEIPVVARWSRANGTIVHEWTPGARKLRQGLSSWWWYAEVPKGKLLTGNYTVEWLIGNSPVAKLSFAVSAK